MLQLGNPPSIFTPAGAALPQGFPAGGYARQATQVRMPIRPDPIQYRPTAGRTAPSRVGTTSKFAPARAAKPAGSAPVQFRTQPRQPPTLRIPARYQRARSAPASQPNRDLSLLQRLRMGVSAARAVGSVAAAQAEKKVNDWKRSYIRYRAMQARERAKNPRAARAMLYRATAGNRQLQQATRQLSDDQAKALVRAGIQRSYQQALRRHTR